MHDLEPHLSGEFEGLRVKHQLPGPARRLDPGSEAMLDEVLGITRDEANRALHAKLDHLAKKAA